MKRVSILASLGLSAVMTASLLTGCGASDGKIDGTKIAATVNDEEITLGELSFVTRYQQAVSYSYYSSLFGSSSLFDTVADEETGETYGEQVVDGILEEYEELILLKQHASDYSVELTDEENTEIEEAAKSFIESNDQETLDKIGASEEDVVNYLSLCKIKEKMMEAMVADVDTEVTEDESNQTAVRIIRLEIEDSSDDEAMTTLKSDMQSIYDALAAEEDLVNADMLTIAQGINEDATTVINSYTTADPTDTSLDANAVDAVKDKEAGELSDGYFESADGSYLMVAVNLGHDDERTESKVTSIISDRKQSAYDDLLSDWKESAEFIQNEDVINLVTVTDSVAYTQASTEESTESSDEPESTDDSASTEVSVSSESEEASEES